MWSMWFSPRMARQLTERCLEVRISALLYARLAGLLSHTEVNDAHLVAAQSYLTAPVTLPPPLSTCCVRLRARLPHMVVRALTCVAFQRNSPTAGRYVPLTFPSSLSAIVSRRLSILFTVRSFSLCWLRWICCIFAKIFPPLSANISPHATCQHFLLPFRAGDFGITPYMKICATFEQIYSEMF